MKSPKRRNIISLLSLLFTSSWSFVDDKNSVYQASDIVSSVQALHADLSGLKIRPFIILHEKFWPSENQKSES